jgi:hypothetical protein
VTLAITGNTWIEVILLLSAVVPLTIVGVVIWVFLRHWRDDPDEQRWRRLAEQRKEAERDAD